MLSSFYIISVFVKFTLVLPLPVPNELTSVGHSNITLQMVVSVQISAMIPKLSRYNVINIELSILNFAVNITIESKVVFMQKSAIALVPCTISNGMFPNEYAVEIKLSSSEALSLFAEKSDLESIDLGSGTAYLKVKLLGEQDKRGKEMLMYLPKESLETGSHLFEFPREKVKQMH